VRPLSEALQNTVAAAAVFHKRQHSSSSRCPTHRHQPAEACNALSGCAGGRALCAAFAQGLACRMQPERAQLVVLHSVGEQRDQIAGAIMMFSLARLVIGVEPGSGVAPRFWARLGGVLWPQLQVDAARAEPVPAGYGGGSCSAWERITVGSRLRQGQLGHHSSQSCHLGLVAALPSHSARHLHLEVSCGLRCKPPSRR
jgi:hypothetical protein